MCILSTVRSYKVLSNHDVQAHQERAYQEYLATKSMEKTQQQESYYEQQLAVHQSEVSTLKSQVIGLKKDLETIKTKCNEASEKLMEKTRQYQKLQVSFCVCVCVCVCVCIYTFSLHLGNV